MRTADYVKITSANLILVVTLLTLNADSLTRTASASKNKDLISTKEIQLVDKNGVIRGGLKLVNDEVPILYFTDKSQKVRCYMAYHKGSSMVVLNGKDEKVRLDLSVDEEQTPNIIMKNHDNQTAIAMRANKKGANGITLFQKNGKPRMILGISNDQPRIGMFDEDKRLRVMFGMNPGNSSVLAFLDEKSYPALAMGHLLGTPIFRLQRPGRTGVFASYAPDNNVILSMQKEGRFTWSVPEIPRGGRAGDDPLNGIDWDNMIKGWSK